MRHFARIGTIFVQSKKHEEHPWGSVKAALLPKCFLRFLYCANGTKSRKASQIKLHQIYLLNNFVNNPRPQSQCNKKYRSSYFRGLLQCL